MIKLIRSGIINLQYYQIIDDNQKKNTNQQDSNQHKQLYNF